jgi:hypothetical protein
MRPQRGEPLGTLLGSTAAAQKHMAWCDVRVGVYSHVRLCQGDSETPAGSIAPVARHIILLQQA